MANLTNLNNKFLVTTGGNVGINTTSPAQKVEIAGGYLKFSGGDYGIQGSASLTYNPVSDHYFQANGSTKVTIKADGKVGIGTTSPTRQLHILNSSGDNRGIMVENTVATSYAEVQIKAAREFRIGTGGSSSDSNASDRFYIFDATAAAHRFTISSTGNVGIGEASPATKLDVRGTDNGDTVRISNTGTYGGTISFTQGSSDTNIGYVGSLRALEGNASGDNGIGLYSRNRISFYTNSATPDVTISDNGNVGIGATTPASKLHVQGAIGVTTGQKIGWIYNPGVDDNMYNYILTANNGGVPASPLEISGSRWTSGNTKSVIFTHQTGGEIMTIMTGGYVGIGTSSPNKTLTVYGGNDNGIWIDSQGGQYTSLAFGHNGTEKANIAWDNTNGYTNISTYGNGHLALTTGGGIKAFLNYNGNFGIGTTAPSGKLEVAGGNTLGFRLSNLGNQSAYDQIRMTYTGYNSGAPTVTFMPLTTPGSGNAYTTFHFSNTNGINPSSNNNANVDIDGNLTIGNAKGLQETILTLRNYDANLASTNTIQASLRMSGRYWSGSTSQLVETRINSVHQESNGNGGSALTFMTQTGGDSVVEQMRIDKVGNVGIGTTNPGATLDVDDDNTGKLRLLRNGSVRAEFSNNANEGELSLYRSNNSKYVYLSSYYNCYIDPQQASAVVGIGGAGVGIAGSGPGGNTTLDVQGPLRNKRVMRGWYHCGPITSTDAYRHIKTNLWMGGSPAGNTEYIMGGFEAKGFAYYGSYPGFSHGTCMFHNWSGAFPSLDVRNFGASGFMQNPYVSSDGYCVIVLRHNTYMQPAIDFSQYYTSYPWRTAYVTAETTSNNLTGVY